MNEPEDDLNEYMKSSWAENAIGYAVPVGIKVAWVLLFVLTMGAMTSSCWAPCWVFQYNSITHVPVRCLAELVK